MATTQMTKNRINKDFFKLGSYHNSIPLDKIFGILSANGMQAIDTDGSPWEGFLCGDDGHTCIDLENQKNIRLILDWHKMQSGRIEINVYVS